MFGARCAGGWPANCCRPSGNTPGSRRAVGREPWRHHAAQPQSRRPRALKEGRALKLDRPLTVYFARRCLLLAVALSAVLWQDASAALGMAAGSAVAVAKIGLWESRPSALAGAAAPLISFAALLAAMLAGARVFAGCAAGLLSVPLIICLSALVPNRRISSTNSKSRRLSCKVLAPRE
jgi:hypothetical protein